MDRGLTLNRSASDPIINNAIKAINANIEFSQTFVRFFFSYFFVAFFHNYGTTFGKFVKRIKNSNHKVPEIKHEKVIISQALNFVY